MTTSKRANKGGAGMQALREELRGDPPAGVAALNDSELGALADALRTARERQSAELHDAIESAYNQLPRLVRIPVRKIFGG